MRDEVVDTFSSARWGHYALNGICLAISYYLGSFVYAYWTASRSPLRQLRSPSDHASWIFGHVRGMLDSVNNEVQARWEKELGDTFAIRSMLGKYQLVTTDPRANTHILFATQTFEKSEKTRRLTRLLLGESLLTTHGEHHREQRRMLNPAFGFAHTRNLTNIFLEKAAELRDIWVRKCEQAGGSVQLNVLDWMSKATLDAIGKAGFDYDFGGLEETGRTNELASAMEKVFRSNVTVGEQMRELFTNHFPLLLKISPGDRIQVREDGRKKMNDIGMRIVQERKAAILAEVGGERASIDKSSVGGKDIISLLLQANLASDVPESQRISDQEVVSHIPTFIVAGHETTSNSTTWAMFALAQNPVAQRKLREEMLHLPDSPTLDELNALPYLDKVTREVLRLHTVVTYVEREAYTDAVIPLGKSAVDRNGNTITQIMVKKGDQIMVPIWLINRSKSIWGPDAEEFRPERWDNPPPEAAGIPGIAPNLMSFIGGPHACIGFRFAIAEMKCLLFHIVRNFEWKLAVDPADLVTKTDVVMPPMNRHTGRVELQVLLSLIA